MSNHENFTDFHPKVTIVIPVYNGSDYLALSIESALGQTYNNVEIIVVNDGSTDGGRTDAIARQYQSKNPEKIKYIIQTNCGVGGALNRGIAEMTGGFFTWLSHDDIYIPTKTQVQLDAWIALDHPDAILISDYKLVTSDGKVYADSNFPHDEFVTSPSLPIYRGAINGCTVFIPAHILRCRPGPFKPELRHTQDYDLWHYLLERTDFFHLAEPLVHYRVHPTQDSAKSTAGEESDPLWRRMIEATNQRTRAMLYGSSWKFFDETFKVLNPSPNKNSSAYCRLQRDTCLNDTLVTVIIPFRGHPDAVIRSVRSALDQTHRNLQIIVVNNNSAEWADELLQIAGTAPQLELLQVRDESSPRARSAGLAAARGEYIAFLNPPDVWFPHKLATQIDVMAREGALVSRSSYFLDIPNTSLVLVDINGDGSAPRAEALAMQPVAATTTVIHALLASEALTFDTSSDAWPDLIFCFEATVLHGARLITEPLAFVEASRLQLRNRRILELKNFICHFEDKCYAERQLIEISELNSTLNRLLQMGRHVPDRASSEEDIQLLVGTATVRSAFSSLVATIMESYRRKDSPTVLFLMTYLERYEVNASLSLTMAQILSALGKKDHAGEWIDRCLRSDPSSDERHSARHLLSNLHVHFGRVKQACDLLKELHSERPDNDIIAYELLSVLAYSRRFDDAWPLQKSAISILTGANQSITTDSLRFFDGEGYNSDVFNRLLGRLIEIEYEALQKLDRCELVHLVACDGRYFKLFIASVVRSLERNAGVNVGLHIHLVCPDRADLDLLNRLRADTTLSISASIERVNLEQLTVEQRKVYFSCARFLVLPQLMSLLDKPFLITDIDQIVIKPLTSLLNRLEIQDCGMIVNEQNANNILSLISASILMANKTEGARQFFQNVEAYIVNRVIELRGLQWHLDQAALAVCYLQGPYRYLRIETSAMRSEVYNGREQEPGDEIFWSVTYSIPENAPKLNSALLRDLS